MKVNLNLSTDHYRLIARGAVVMSEDHWKMVKAVLTDSQWQFLWDAGLRLIDMELI